MSANLTAYKTIFVKPDSTNSSIELNRKVAYAMIFKPLQTGGPAATLEDVYLLLNTDTRNPIRYRLGIFEVEDQSSLIPALSSLDDIKDGLWYSEVEVQATDGSSSNWVKFEVDAAFSNPLKYYAMVLTSDLDESLSVKNNGILYSKISNNPNNAAFIKKSFVFNEYSQEWMSKTEDNYDISANVFMFSGVIDDTTALDAGAISTSGADSLRGYELFLTLRNDGTSSARNIILYPTVDSSVTHPESDTYAEETYLAATKWSRYEVNSLPVTHGDFTEKLKDSSSNPVKEIKPGDFVLYVQPERVYPYPKTYIHTTEATRANSILDETVTLNQIDPNGLVYYKRTDGDLLLDASESSFKFFKLYDRNLYRDSSGITLPIGEGSPLVGKYIKRFSDESVKSGYLIKSHDAASEIVISSRRVYPMSDHETTYTNPASRNQSMISRSDLSSIYCNHWDQFRFNLCSNGRFYDSKSTSVVNGQFQFGRLFAIPVSNSETDVASGQAQDKASAKDDQIPYFIVNNITNPITGQGNYIQSIGFSLFSGRSTNSYYSLLVPEFSDLEAFTRMGLMDKDKYFPDSYTKPRGAQGLILTTHYVRQVENKDLIDAFVIRKIDNTGIMIDGRVISTGYFDSVTEEDEDTLKIHFPTVRFTAEQNVQLQNKITWLLPNPTSNPLLATGQINSSFIIRRVEDHYMYVTGSLADFTLASGGGVAGGQTPCYITYRGDLKKSTYYATSNPNQIIILMDYSGSVVDADFYAEEYPLLQNIHNWIDSLEEGTEVKVATNTHSTSSDYHFHKPFMSNKAQIKAKFTTLFNKIRSGNMANDFYGDGDEWNDVLTDIASEEVFSENFDNIIIIFGDGQIEGNEILTLDSTVEALKQRNIVVSCVHCIPSSDYGSFSKLITTGGIITPYYNYETQNIEDIFKDIIQQSVSFRINAGSGHAYGLGKFDNPPSSDFFVLHEDKESPDFPSYGKYFGTVIREREGYPDEWIGSGKFDSSITGYEPYKGSIVIVLEPHGGAGDESSDNYFFSNHNKYQIEKFIDSLLPEVKVGFVAGVEVFSPTSNKAASKADFNSLWDDLKKIQAGASNNYNYLLQTACSLFTGRNNTIFLIGSNNSFSTLDNTTKNLVFDSSVKVNCIRTNPALAGSYMPEISRWSNGQYTTYASSSNLCQIMSTMICGTPRASEFAYVPPEVYNYSIIVPLTLRDHNRSLSAYTDMNTDFSGASTGFISETEDTAYEVYRTPIDEWSESNDSYYISEPSFSPLNHDKITKHGPDATIFTFDNNDAQNNYLNNNSWVVHLASISPDPTSGFNRISMAYKVGIPGSASSSSNTSVRLTIHVGTEKNFDLESDGTKLLFDGIIDSESTSFTPVVVTDHTLKANGFLLPDGYNLFLLDLKHRLTFQGAKYMRIYMTPVVDNDDEGNNSVSQYVIVKSLRINEAPDATFSYSSVFGSVENAMEATESTGATISKNGQFLVVDLGRERHIRNVKFEISSYSGDNDTLTISTKSFVNQDSISEDLLKTINLSQEALGSSFHGDIKTARFGRLIIFKYSGFGSFNIKNVSVSAGSNSEFYDTSNESEIASNYTFSFYDENIKTAPSNRVAMLNNSRKFVGIHLSDQDPVPVTQVSFSAITDKSTLFSLQKYSGSSFGSIDPKVGWTTIKTFQVKDYNRLPGNDHNAVIAGISSDGLTITDTSIPQSRVANNGLAGYVLRPVTGEEIPLLVIESWISGSENFIKVNADLQEIGISVGTPFYVERSNVVTFPSQNATALQLVQISGGNTKINNLKAYTNLMNADGLPIPPTTGADALQWKIQIDTI